MPELPEVETVLRGLKPTMENQTFTSVFQNRPDLRYPFPTNFVERLTNKYVTSLHRRAKYLIINLDSNEALILHLGMSGHLQISAEYYQPKTHDHVVFRMSNKMTISYNDPRRFGFMDLSDQEELTSCKYFAHLGPEPLENDFTASYLFSLSRGKQTTVKSLLLDQRIVAGLGNIYVCEALFLARIQPILSSQLLTLHMCERLVSAIQMVLKEAIKAGGSTLKDHKQVTGDIGYFQHQFKVYGRKKFLCYLCQTPIEQITQAGRSTFYCPCCQS